MDLLVDVLRLLLLALPVAWLAWTVTKEEVFREVREFCADRSKNCRHLAARKFFYLFTCEYCFSHWLAGLFLWITRHRLIYGDWRWYLLGFFALVWIANLYMSIFDRLRLDIKRERVEIKGEEHKVRRRTGEGERKAA